MITCGNEPDRFALYCIPIEYKSRTAGTARDNPSMFEVLAITECNYYKNRLFFYTNVGTVISTRAGEIDNFFLKTALTSSLSTLLT